MGYSPQTLNRKPYNLDPPTCTLFSPHFLSNKRERERERERASERASERGREGERAREKERDQGKQCPAPLARLAAPKTQPQAAPQQKFSGAPLAVYGLGGVCELRLRALLQHYNPKTPRTSSQQTNSQSVHASHQLQVCRRKVTFPEI